MPRIKLKTEDKKGKIGITLSKDVILKLNLATYNKSKYIEDLLLKHFKGNKNGK